MAQPKSADELFNETPTADQLFEAEGGAEGGAEGPSKPLLPRGGNVPEPADQKARREKYEHELGGAELSGGQSLSSMPEADRKAHEDYENASVGAKVVATARGLPIVGAHLDEVAGALQSGGVSGADYEKKRDAARSTVDASVRQNPRLPIAGSFAPGSGPANAIGRILLGTAAGASEGIGEAPTMSQAPKMGLIGAGAGLGMSLVGEGLRSSGGYLGAKKQGVLDKTAADTERAAQKAFASARGGLGAETSSAMRTYEVLEKAASDPSLPEEVSRAAAARLEEPDMQALRAQVIQSHVGRSYDSAARIDSAKRSMAEAGQALQPDALAAATQRRIDDPSALMRRLRELGPKVLLPTLGGALAGPAGAGAGAISGAVLGRSGTTIRNALVDPYVATRLLGAGETALSGAGRVATASSPAAAREALAPYLELLKDEKK